MSKDKVIPEGWMLERDDRKPFHFINITAPNGYKTRVGTVSRNPEYILYLLADALLKKESK